MCWKPTPTKFSTRRRTASTWKRPCWRCCWRGNKSIAVRGAAGESERANLPFFVEVMGKREAMARLRAGHARPLRTVEKWDVGRPAPRPPCPFATRRSLAEHCRGRRPRRPAGGERRRKVRGRDESLPYGLPFSCSWPGGCGGVKTPPYDAKDKGAAMARLGAGHARPLRGLFPAT